jgi:hypothetical protein
LLGGFLVSQDERKQMWQQRIEAYKASGVPSVKAWCNQNQIGLQSMYKWMRRLELEATAVAPPSTQWVAVESSNSIIFDGLTSHLAVKIGDVSIEIKEGFNPKLFTEVLQILQTHVK